MAQETLRGHSPLLSLGIYQYLVESQHHTQKKAAAFRLEKWQISQSSFHALPLLHHSVLMPLLVKGLYWVKILKNTHLPGNSEIPACASSSAREVPQMEHQTYCNTKVRHPIGDVCFRDGVILRITEILLH